MHLDVELFNAECVVADATLLEEVTPTTNSTNVVYTTTTTPVTTTAPLISATTYTTTPTTTKPATTTTSSLPSILEVFSNIGGLALLAEKLPFFMPQPIHQISSTAAQKVAPSKSSSNLASTPSLHKWSQLNMKKQLIVHEYHSTISSLPPSPPLTTTQPNPFSSQPLPFSTTIDTTNNQPPATKPRQMLMHKHFVIPPHTMVCFSLALRLPCYAQALLKENKKTRCMLRIMLGVIDQDAIRDIGLSEPFCTTK